MRIIAARLPGQPRGGGLVLQADILQLRPRTRCSISSARAGSWNKSRMRCSSVRRNGSIGSTSFTWMPAAATSVSESSRRGVAHRKLGGDPAAEIDKPTRSTWVRSSASRNRDRNWRGRRWCRASRAYRSPEARMLGHDHVVPRGQLRHAGQPRPGPLAPCSVSSGRPAPPRLRPCCSRGRRFSRSCGRPCDAQRSSVRRANAAS